METSPAGRRRRVACGVTLHLAHRGPYLWEEHEAGLLEDAFARIADSGLELVRLPLIWEDFQPSPGRVAAAALARLTEALDLAAAAGLRVLPWCLVGAWLGTSFLPAWALGPAGQGPSRSVYSRRRLRTLPVLDLWTEPALLDAQRLLLEELAGALAGHPALHGWEVAAVPERAFGPAGVQTHVSWLRRHVELLGEHGGGVPVGASLDAGQLVALAPELARSADWIGLVPSPEPPGYADGPLDPHLMPYLARLLHWLCGRPALVHVLDEPSAPPEAELPLGLPPGASGLHDEADLARHAERLLDLLPLPSLEAIVAGAWSDAGPKLAALTPYDAEPLHRSRGLVRQDRTPKPVLEVLADWGARSSAARDVPETWQDAAPAGAVDAASEALADLGLPAAPARPSSSLLLLPGGEDFDRVARRLSLLKGRSPESGLPRGAAPAWADVTPAEVESDPATHVPRLYRRYRQTLDGR